MDQASLYSKYKGLQKNDADFVIQNYLRLIKWQNNENMLDIGCGDGEITEKHLYPKLPKNLHKLIGADISQEMVEFAKKNCAHEKIHFVQLDVSANEIPVEFESHFHHIFSFYCLHWVAEQRQAMKNICAMLKPGGDILLTFIASNPIYDIYENMAKSNKWAPYMQNYAKFISPYHHSKDAEKDLENLLKKEGLIPHLCRVESRSYTFVSFAVLKKSFLAVNPFASKIPDNQIDVYIEDYIEEVRKLKSVTIEACRNNNNDEEMIHVPYKLFIVFASKAAL